MFRQVFNPDNLLWRIVASGVDFVGLSLFWTFLCLPIVTIGPATAALYYTTVKVFRQRADDGFTLMWKSFLDNLKNGVIATVICIPVVFMIFYGYSVMLANSGSNLGAVMFTFYYLILVIPIGIMIFLFPVMGRFSSGVGQAFRTAAFLAVRHLPSTIILTLLVVQVIIAVIETWAWIFLAPVGCALLASFFMESIFMKYLTKEEEAAFRGMLLEELLEQERLDELRKEEKKQKRNR